MGRAIEVDKRLMNLELEVRDLKKVVSNGKIARAYWCESPKVEDEIKKKTGAKSITGEFSIGDHFCILTGKPATHQHYFGKSY